MTARNGSTPDVYQQVTDRVVAALESGVVPWRKPWTAAGRPRSMATGKQYAGINTLLLGMTGAERGYSSPFWGTYRQIGELGGQVRRGETSTQVVFYKPLEVEDESRPGEKKTIPLLRAFRVFNASQADNLPERFYPEPGAEQPIASAQAVLDAYIGSASAAELVHDVHGEAYYNHLADEIHMPPLAEHVSAERYYSTAFHETVHSTGHHTRLARREAGEGHAFGSHAYGTEELAAEMGAAFLMTETGAASGQTFEQSAAYIGSWLAKIREDKRMVVRAAGQAQKAADLIMAPTREAQRAEPEGQAEAEAA